jgi:hypothetical protein
MDGYLRSVQYLFSIDVKFINMRTYYLVVVLLFLWIGNLVAENENNMSAASPWQSWIILEFNNCYPNGTITSNIAVRQKVNAYDTGYDSNGFVSSDAYGFAGGLQWMFYNTHLKIGVSTGLRYTHYMTEIYGSVSTYSDYFYLRYSESGQETKFARVKTISERKEYLSIPLEISYRVYEYQRIGLWTRVGGEFGLFGLSHKSDISFMESVMEDHETAVLSSIRHPDEKALSNIYWTIGGSYRLKNNISFRMDGIVLSKYLNTDAPFVLVESDYFTGFMMSMQIPISK